MFDRVNARRVLLIAAAESPGLIAQLRAHGLEAHARPRDVRPAMSLLAAEDVHQTVAFVEAEPMTDLAASWRAALPTVLCHPRSEDCAVPSEPAVHEVDANCIHVAAPLLGALRLLLGYPGALSAEGPQQGFSTFGIGRAQIFHETAHSFAIVNIKPVMPGHVLCVSRRRVPRVGALGPDEVADLFQCAQAVANAVSACHAGSTSATFAVQDGPAAGQTVPHVHVHVIPRRPLDLAVGDAVYDMIEAHERELAVTGAAPQVRSAHGGSETDAPGTMSAGGGAGSAAPPAAAVAAVAAAAAAATAAGHVRTALAVDPLRSPARAADAAGAHAPSAAAQAPPPRLRTLDEMAAEAAQYRVAMAAGRGEWRPLAAP